MKLKIVSDGNPINTKVVDVETGKDITKSVRGINWQISVDRLAEAEIVLVGTPVEITGEFKTMIVTYESWIWKRIKQLPGRLHVWYDHVWRRRGGD